MPLHRRALRPQLGRRSRVLERPLEPRLQDDPDVLVSGFAQLAVEPQVVIHRRRVLHVDPHEVATPAARATSVDEVVTAELVAEPEPGAVT